MREAAAVRDTLPSALSVLHRAAVASAEPVASAPAPPAAKRPRAVASSLEFESEQDIDSPRRSKRSKAATAVPEAASTDGELLELASPFSIAGALAMFRSKK